MRIRWKYVLPVGSLILFAAITRNSVQMNQETGREHARYFYWATFRLDPDPLNRLQSTPRPCEAIQRDCWDLRAAWIDPGWAAEAFMLVSAPALAAGAVIVSALGHFGINEIWAFMIAMPLLLFAWYYFVGGLIDRKRKVIS